MTAAMDGQDARMKSGYAAWLEKNRQISPDGGTALEKWLASGFVEGTNPSMARRLTDAFGDQSWQTLLADPMRLSDLPGIRMERALALHSAACAAAPLLDWIRRFHAAVVPYAPLLRYASHDMERRLPLLAHNPWLLTQEAWGLSFPDADRLFEMVGAGPSTDREPGCRNGGQPACPSEPAAESADPVSSFQTSAASDEVRSGSLTGEAERLRMQAAVRLALERGLSDGHTRLTDDMMCARLSAILDMDVSAAATRLEACRNSEGDAEAVSLTGAWALSEILRIERTLAQRLTAMADERRLPPMNATPSWLAGYEMDNGLELSSAQREALRAIGKHGVLCVTGGPGTGKTTLIRGIVRLAEDAGLAVALAAPTGRAAKRMQSATGMEARTIHRLLEVGYDYTDSTRPVFRKNRRNPLECEVLIVDEASMADLFLFSALADACAPGTRLVVVGDADQLPSVGPGQVLADCLASGALPSVVLDRVYRQAAESDILVNAWRIHDGLLPAGLSPDEPHAGEAGDFRIFRCYGAKQAAAAVVALVRDELPTAFGFDPLRDIQVLSPMRRGICGVENLNRLLKLALNPYGEGRQIHAGPSREAVMSATGSSGRRSAPRTEYTRTGAIASLDVSGAVATRGVSGLKHRPGDADPSEPKAGRGGASAGFSVGDRVMQIRNDYAMPWTMDGNLGEEAGEGVFNGDTGLVVASGANGRRLDVRFEDGRVVRYAPEALDALELAYAITVHKSQGCEYPAVVLPLAGVPDALAFRNLLYTGVTRARRLLVLVGSDEEIARLVQGDAGPLRSTGLDECLRAAADGPSRTADERGREASPCG